MEALPCHKFYSSYSAISFSFGLYVYYTVGAAKPHAVLCTEQKLNEPVNKNNSIQIGIRNDKQRKQTKRRHRQDDNTVPIPWYYSVKYEGISIIVRSLSPPFFSFLCSCNFFYLLGNSSTMVVRDLWL